MEERNKFPFPQADDLWKVISILNVENPSSLKDKCTMGIVLGDVTDRQVQYYISACQYLGLISAEKDFTALGHEIRNMKQSQQFVQLARLIVSDNVFGTVYFLEKFLGCKLTREEIVDVMRDRGLQLNCDSMYGRRAQTVLKWVEWVNEHFDCN